MELPKDIWGKNKERVGASKKEWLGTEIKPVSIGEVDKLMAGMHKTVLGLSEYAYTTTRGVANLLEEQSWDYAKLPRYKDISARQMFKELKAGAEWLDAGSGSGTFIKEVLEEVNPKIIATGFDARTWEHSVEIPELVLGDLDKINISMFPKHQKGFDLITSASVFYHLPDYWGVFGRCLNLLKKDGLITVSTISRPISGDRPINNEKGEFTMDPEKNWAKYYRNRNLFDSDGKLLPMSEVIKTLSIDNPGFKIEYHSGPNKDAVMGDLYYGGGLSAKRVADLPINLSSIFYCYYPEKKQEQEIDLNDISFIVARTISEVNKLKKEGYSSVQDRLYG